MRLIDADALREDWLENGANEYIYDTNSFLESIDDAPTVDAVPVVRCENCMHSMESLRSKCVWCRKHLTTMYADNFCGYGIRKKGTDAGGRL